MFASKITNWWATFIHIVTISSSSFTQIGGGGVEVFTPIWIMEGVDYLNGTIFKFNSTNPNNHNYSFSKIVIDLNIEEPDEMCTII